MSVEQYKDAEKREKPAEEVAKKAEKSAKQFVERLKETTEVFKAFTPSTVKGIVTLSVAIPSIYLVAVSIGAVAPHVAQYMYIYAPILVQFIAIFIAFSIFALAFGMVRRLVL